MQPPGDVTTGGAAYDMHHETTEADEVDSWAMQDRKMAALDRVTVLTAYHLLASGQLPDLLSVDAVDRFPVEPPEGSVLRYVKTFGSGERSYTYVALRVGDQWYVTGRRSTPMSFAELVEDIGDSPCSIATDWAVIPTPEPSPFEDMTPAEWHAAMWPQNTTVEGSTSES